MKLGGTVVFSVVNKLKRRSHFELVQQATKKVGLILKVLNFVNEMKKESSDLHDLDEISFLFSFFFCL